METDDRQAADHETNAAATDGYSLSEVKANLPTLIGQYRQDHNLSQEQMAALLGLKRPSSVGRYEKAENTPRPRVVAALQKLLESGAGPGHEKSVRIRAQLIKALTDEGVSDAVVERYVGLAMDILDLCLALDEAPTETEP